MVRQRLALLAILWVCVCTRGLQAQQTASRSPAQSGKPATRLSDSLPRQRGDVAFRTKSKGANQDSRNSKAGQTPQQLGGKSDLIQAATSRPAKVPTQLPSFQQSGPPSQSVATPPIVRVAPGSRSLNNQDPTGSSDEGSNGEDSIGNDSAAGEADSDQATGEEEEDEDEELEEETFFRPEIHRVGPITMESIYTGEVFNNAHGGMSTSNATRYRGNLDLTFQLDFEQAGLWSGGEVFVYFHQSHGTTLTPDFIGDGQYYSNIDTGPRPQSLSRLGEYWFRQTTLDETAAFKIGRQDANADFAFCDLGGDFLNSSFVTIPNIPMPFWPFQALGASGIVQVDEHLKFGGGVYDHSHNQEQWWTTPMDQGIFTIWQADLNPFAAIENANMTLMRLGGWYSSADTLAIGQTNFFPENYGFYTTLDRLLVNEPGSEDQGLGAFFQFSWAPADRNQVDRAYAAGLVYRGLVDYRDADTCGVAYTGILFGDRQEAETGQTSEDVMELFYKARLRRGISLQPDIQYIARPNGLERDALVVGIRYECNF